MIMPVVTAVEKPVHFYALPDVLMHVSILVKVIVRGIVQEGVKVVAKQDARIRQSVVPHLVAEI